MKLEKMTKNLVLDLILVHLAQIRATKNLFLSVNRYHGQLLSCTIPQKTNDQILRKLSDGWTDKRTDGWTDEPE